MSMIKDLETPHPHNESYRPQKLYPLINNSIQCFANSLFFKVFCIRSVEVCIKVKVTSALMHFSIFFKIDFSVLALFICSPKQLAVKYEAVSMTLCIQ